MTRINLGTDSSGRPLIMDDRTLAKLEAAQDVLGFTFTIVQGSYSHAEKSAGTHSGGGAGDLRSWNLPPSISIAKALTALREAGLIAWYRTRAQGFAPHIHFIDYGNPWLSPAAVRQVIAWEQGGNGLANNRPDDGPRVNIPKNPPTGGLMTKEYDALTTQIEALSGKVGWLISEVGKVKAAEGRAESAQNNQDIDAIKADVAEIKALLQSK